MAPAAERRAHVVDQLPKRCGTAGLGPGPPRACSSGEAPRARAAPRERAPELQERDAEHERHRQTRHERSPRGLDEDVHRHGGEQHDASQHGAANDDRRERAGQRARGRVLLERRADLVQAIAGRVARLGAQRMVAEPRELEERGEAPDGRGRHREPGERGPHELGRRLPHRARGASGRERALEAAVRADDRERARRARRADRPGSRRTSRQTAGARTALPRSAHHVSRRSASATRTISAKTPSVSSTRSAAIATSRDGIEVGGLSASVRRSRSPAIAAKAFSIGWPSGPDQ